MQKERKGGLGNKVVFVVNDASYFLSHRIDLALALVDRGMDVCVAIPEIDAGKSKPIQNKGIRVVEYKFFRGGMNPLKEILTVWSLYNVFAREMPDVIHLLTVKPVLYGGMAARFFRAPKRVSAFLGLGYLFYSSGIKARVIRVLVRPLFKFALGGGGSYMIFQNPDDRDELVKLGIVKKEQLLNTKVVLGSGVNELEYIGLEEVSPKIVLFAGRLTLAKGVLEFCQAANVVKENFPEVRFVICGEVDFENPEAVKEGEINQWVDGGIVEWWGRKENMKEIVGGAAVVVLPSHYGEGVPKILIEAASCSRPIVTTDSPGCREIVKDNVNGFLVPVKNSAALASSISKLLASESKRREMGREGRKRVETMFSLNAVIEQTLEIYERSDR